MIRWHLKSQIAHIEEDYRQLNGPPAPKTSQLRRFGQFFCVFGPKDRRFESNKARQRVRAVILRPYRYVRNFFYDLTSGSFPPPLK